MNRTLRLLVLLPLLIGVGDVSLAGMVGLRLSYTDDVPTTMTISWNTPTASTSEVRFGTSPGMLPQAQSGSTSVAPGTLGFLHEVTLTGLQTDTSYYYVADSGADGVSAEQSFITRPAASEECGSTSFVFMGDSEPDPLLGGGEVLADILGEANSHQPSFILHGGDMVADADDTEGWSDFLTWTEAVSAQTPFMGSIGNHDTGPGEGDSANYNQVFALPRSAGNHGSGTEDYYYFTSGNALFVVLSTETFAGGDIPFDTQAAWLDEVLTQNPRRWKFVIYHKPSYTEENLFGTSHPPNEEAQNAALIPVIDAHHVDVVFSGHNHWYERYEPSACSTQGGSAGSDQPCGVGGDYSAGTVYIVSGGGGALTLPALLCGAQPGRAFCASGHHYMLATIEDELLTLEAWAAFPQASQVIDSITIEKPATTCPEPGSRALGLGGFAMLGVMARRRHGRN